MDNAVLYNLTYGLYLCTTKEGYKDNGCIINTAVQVANDPTRIMISVNKNNYTCELISRTGLFNISAITTTASFDLFKTYGMASGRDTDKFAGATNVKRSDNGLYYLAKDANMYLSAAVISEYDLGSHMLFIAEVLDGKVLSNAEPCTYTYYQKNIKPQPKPATQKKWVCNVCGYVYEGDELPEDFVCPWCKHPKEDFSLA